MYLLNPKDRKPDWDKSHGGFGYDKTTSHFTSGFIMAPINARVKRHKTEQWTQVACHSRLLL